MGPKDKWPGIELRTTAPYNKVDIFVFNSDRLYHFRCQWVVISLNITILFMIRMNQIYSSVWQTVRFVETSMQTVIW
jgi:hypothetical protein